MKISDLILAGLRNRSQAEAEPRPENPLFDRAFYAEANPFVVKGGIDLHEHYSYFGCRNGYDPNPHFDSAYYLAQNPDVAATGANPLDHYLDRGAHEGRNPSPLFSSWLYLILYPDVRATAMNPLLHYLVAGKAEGRLAPPVCLLPSLAAMHAPLAADDVAALSAAGPAVDLLIQWAGKLAEARRP